MLPRPGMCLFIPWGLAALVAAACPATAQEGPPKKVALLVGVNRYTSRILFDKPLEYAERDVEELAKVLRSRGFDDVRLLTGNRATKGAIDDALNALLDGRAASDLVLIGFAGHGVQVPQVDDQGQPLKDERGNTLSDAYFCPSNAVMGKTSTMIRLMGLVEQLKREGGINMILVDACRELPPDPERGGLTRSLSGDELVGRLPGNSVILFSCSAGQQAIETVKAGGGHGVFFHHVIEALQGRAADEAGEVAWFDLASYVSKNVNRRAREWEPERARRADLRTPGALQTPHMLGNLASNPTLARVDRSVPPPAPRFADSLGIKLVRIPAGEFWMGSTPGEIDKVLAFAPKFNKSFADVEQPRHRVRISEDFSLSAHEVTLGQFRRFIQDSGYQTDAERDGKGGYGFDGEGKYRQDPRFSWRDPGFPQTDDHPVTNVSWNDATEFCRWLSRKDGRTFRLPTEAEWEYGCRAGSDSLFSHGDDPEGLARVGNIADASWSSKYSNSNFSPIKANDQFVYTAPVGRFAPNAFGLYDMHGNVWEWCVDSDRKYGEGQAVDPAGPSGGSYRVFRGGSWNSSAEGCRSAYRSRNSPEFRRDSVGFRCAARGR